MIETAAYIAGMFYAWGLLFVAPFRHPEMLWILIPVYLMWVFTEIFQEKKGTSLGNAITNAVVLLWVGVDWLRTLFSITYWYEKDMIFLAKIGLSALMILYGFLLVILGLKLVKTVRIFGKIRVIAYFIITFTPVIYGFVDLTVPLVFSVFIGAPIFYFLFATIFAWIPNPKTYDIEKKPGLEPAPIEPIGDVMENMDSVFSDKST